MTLAASVFSQRQILGFWLPLAASWWLMSAEGPILQAAIARLPDMKTQLAAFGIVLSLEIAIESPVIMLLATSTALATSAANYRTLRRFVAWTNLLVTIVAAVVAFTPVYDGIVPGIMGIPRHISEAARPGMKIMTLWSAAIGIRRFYQGVLIRQGRTRSVGLGTFIRLVSSAGTGITLAIFTQLPGVHIATIGLMAGVLVEAAFVLQIVQPTLHRLRIDSQESEAISFSEVVRYHAPLAATSLLTLLAQPLIGAGLARMPLPEESLAAWPVVWGILFLFRSPAMALPEAVIALVTERRLLGEVRRFCLRVGIASSIAMVLLAATPLLALYLHYFAGLPDSLAHSATIGLSIGLVIPYLNAQHSWFRGLLMAARRTQIIYWGMGLNLLLTALVVLLGVLMQWTGIIAAVLSLGVSLVIENFYLATKTGVRLL